jgi:hypothetical protein
MLRDSPVGLSIESIWRLETRERRASATVTPTWTARHSPPTEPSANQHRDDLSNRSFTRRAVWQQIAIRAVPLH